jgi:APA family basic amino acid/polyamine antiporter
MSTITSPPGAADVAGGGPKLRRSMGLWMATALVVGNMIGSGVFLLPAALAGTAGPYAYALQSRVPLAAAEDGLLPPQFAKVHGKRRTPVFGLVVSSVLVTALMLMNYTKGLVDAFTFVILLATLTTLVPYAYSVWAIAGSGQEIIAKGFVLLLAGIPIYVGMRWWQQRDAGHAPDALSLVPQGVEAPDRPRQERSPALTTAGNGRGGA